MVKSGEYYRAQCGLLTMAESEAYTLDRDSRVFRPIRLTSQILQCSAWQDKIRRHRSVDYRAQCGLMTLEAAAAYDGKSTMPIVQSEQIEQSKDDVIRSVKRGEYTGEETIDNLNFASPILAPLYRSLASAVVCRCAPKRKIKNRIGVWQSRSELRAMEVYFVDSGKRFYRPSIVPSVPKSGNPKTRDKSDKLRLARVKEAIGKSVYNRLTLRTHGVNQFFWSVLGFVWEYSDKHLAHGTMSVEKIVDNAIRQSGHMRTGRKRKLPKDYRPALERLASELEYIASDDNWKKELRIVESAGTVDDLRETIAKYLPESLWKALATEKSVREAIRVSGIPEATAWRKIKALRAKLCLKTDLM